MFKSYLKRKKESVKHIDEEIDSKLLDLQLRLKRIHSQIIQMGQNLFYLDELFKNYKEIINYQYDKDSEMNNNFQTLIVNRFMNSPIGRFVWDNATYNQEKTPFFIIQIEALEQFLLELSQIKEEYKAFNNDILKNRQYKNYSLDHVDFLEQLQEVINKTNSLLKLVKQQDIVKYFKIINHLPKKKEMNGIETKIKLNIKAHVNKSIKAKFKKISDIESGMLSGKFYFVLENTLPSVMTFLNKTVCHRELGLIFKHMIEVSKFIDSIRKKHTSYNKEPALEKKKLLIDELHLLPKVLVDFIESQNSQFLQFQHAKNFVLHQTEKLISDIKKGSCFAHDDSYNESIQKIRVILDLHKTELVPTAILKLNPHLLFCGEHTLNYYVFLSSMGSKIKAKLLLCKPKIKEQEKIEIIERVIQLIDGISANATIICGDRAIRYQDTSFKNHFRSIDKIENTKKLPNVKNLEEYLRHLKTLYMLLELNDHAFTLDDLTDLAYLYKMNFNSIANYIDERIKLYANIKNSFLPFISEIYFGYTVPPDKDTISPESFRRHHSINNNENKKKSKSDVHSIMPEVIIKHSFLVPRSQTSPGREMRLPDKSEIKKLTGNDGASREGAGLDKRSIFAGTRTSSLRVLPRIKVNSENRNREESEASDIDSPKLKRNNNF
ncbi:MAG TPA: hypothetical protein PK657_05295 [Legionella sp.]|nr:hypothetical protein [Legionella sp.]